LLQVIKEDSEPTFAAYLKSQNGAFTGVAVSLTNRPSDAEAQVRVQYIYRGHNEVQGVYLEKGTIRLENRKSRERGAASHAVSLRDSGYGLRPGASTRCKRTAVFFPSVLGFLVNNQKEPSTGVAPRE